MLLYVAFHKCTVGIPLTFRTNRNLFNLRKHQSHQCFTCWCFSAVAVTSNCSFPFTYNGGLYYSCIDNIENVSPDNACLADNATAILCDISPSSCRSIMVYFILCTHCNGFFLNLYLLFHWLTMGDEICGNGDSRSIYRIKGIDQIVAM